MYARDISREERPEVLHAAIDTLRLGILIVADEDGVPHAVAVPFVLKHLPDGAVLEAHVARANPIWKLWPRQALVLFQGPQSYVRPGWYPAKQEHGKVVPTWAYVMVEARGRIEIFDDMAATLTHIRELSDVQEGGEAAPWSVDDAPEGFIPALARGIVAFRIPIASLAGVWKLNQHRSEADRDGMAEGLASRDDAGAHALSDVMRSSGLSR
ncbi:MAG: FMN-binding negative transcriptional regulator [Beijerinckiaceae bacterium]